MRYLAALSLVLLVACNQSEPAGQSDRTAAAAVTAPAAAPAAAPAVAKGRFAPRDECRDLPGASDFRERVIEAVMLRDTDAMAAFASPDIELDFGGGTGIEEFKKRLRAGGEPSLWQSLDQLLKLGCAASGSDKLVMPWLVDQDLGAIDPFVARLVLGEDVPILAEPRASASQTGTISWELVNVPAFDPGQAYQRISMPGSAVGYIATDKLRSVVDYRMLASRADGQWKIMALVAGD